MYPPTLSPTVSASECLDYKFVWLACQDRDYESLGNTEG